MKRAVDDLPLVPTTWIEAKRRWGMPSTVISLCMRSRPKRIPNSSSPSRYSSAWRKVIGPPATRAPDPSPQPAQRLAMILELAPLLLDDLRGSPLDEPLVGQLRLRPLDLLT